MTISIKHKFNCLIPDATDDTQIRPSNWNDTHEISGIIETVNGVAPDTNGNVIIPPQTIDCGTFQ